MIPQFKKTSAGRPAWSGLLLTALLLSGCDSTPRERQEVVRQGAHELDTLARGAAQKLAHAGRATARYDAANRARRAQPLDPHKEIAMENQLMGPYSGQLNSLTPDDLPAAYGQLVRETRTRRTTWTDRDWDYARAVYRRLNNQVKQIRLDLPARDELRIRARQAEFVSLQAGHAAQGISEANKEPAAK